MNRRNLLTLLGVGALASTLGACDAKKVFGCMPADDPWKKPPSQRDVINDVNNKPNTVFVPVPDDKFDQALVRLKKTTFAPVTDKDLADLGVTAPAEAAGLSPYVMRALSTRPDGGPDKGKHLLIYMEDHVWVRYVRSDHDTCSPIFHDAIVAWLPKAPLATFATQSVNE